MHWCLYSVALTVPSLYASKIKITEFILKYKTWGVALFCFGFLFSSGSIVNRRIPE